MRKLVVSNIVSLDGYYTGPGDDVMVMPMDDAFDAYNAERLNAADTLLLGAKSFDGFRQFWPGVVDDPDASPAKKEVSRRDNEIDKVVVSDSLTPEQTTPWQNSTRIVKRAHAHEQIATLKGEDGKDILVFASQKLWSDLLAHELVDELHLMVGSVVVGGGRRVFESPPPGSLRLSDTRTFEDSGNVVLRYEVTPEQPATMPTRD